jgi:integrase
MVTCSVLTQHAPSNLYLSVIDCAASCQLIVLPRALTRAKVKHRAAITEPSEVAALVRAIDGYSGQPTTRMALQLSALVFVRPGEIRHARWREFDLSDAVWRIPADSLNNG